MLTDLYITLSSINSIIKKPKVPSHSLATILKC